MNIIVPVSGGKDSTACLIMAIKDYGADAVIAIFNDTGWDHPVTYAYLKYLEQRLNVKIYSTVGNDKNKIQGKSLVNLIVSQGRFPFGLGRFCTTHLKQYALRDYYKHNLFDGLTEYEMWFGMRTAESNARSIKYKGITKADSFDMEDVFPSRYNKKLRSTLSVRLPICDWSTEETFKYLSDEWVKPNPLYFEGTNDRVGCYPCLLAGKNVQKAMFATKVGKRRLAVIKYLERELGQKYEMFDTDQGSCELCKI